MAMVHPSVHPIEAPPMTEHAIAIAMPRHTLKDTQGMPGTLGGFLLRFAQFSFALVSLSVMATTSDFPSVTAFRYSLIPPFPYFLFNRVLIFNWVCGNCWFGLVFCVQNQHPRFYFFSSGFYQGSNEMNSCTFTIFRKNWFLKIVGALVGILLSQVRTNKFI